MYVLTNHSGPSETPEKVTRHLTSCCMEQKKGIWQLYNKTDSSWLVIIKEMFDDNVIFIQMKKWLGFQNIRFLMCLVTA